MTRERWTGGIVAVVVVFVTLRAFGPALSLPFTDADAWADVAFAGRPLGEQWLTRLTGGVAGEDANFWRPTMMVQFWVERRLFGWEPWGWHAWDLAAHVVASLLAGRFVAVHARFAGAPRWFAPVATLLFAAHPLTEEVVPAVARTIDLTLAVTTFASLIALVEWQARRSWWMYLAHLAFAALALGAKELAVLLLPLSVAWILLFRRDLAWRARWVEGARVGAPLAVLVAGWLVVRAQVLGGFGGYHAGAVRLDWILDALLRGAIEPWVPALGSFFPEKGVERVVAAGVWAVVAVAAGRSEHRRTALFAAGWFIASVVVFALTGTCSRRVFYVPTLPGLLLLLVAAWESRIGRAAAVGWLATFFYGTPVVSRYPDWGIVARASEVYRASSVWGELPPGTEVWLVDRPFRADVDPRRFRFWGGGRALGLAHGATAYSLEAWLAERWPERRLSVQTLTGFAMTRAEQEVTVSGGVGELLVRHSGGIRQRWDVRSPFVVEGDEILRISGTPRRAVVVVWTPDGLRVWTPRTGELSHQ